MKRNLLIGTILSVLIAADLSLAQEHDRVPITDEGPEHHLIYPLLCTDKTGPFTIA